MIARLSLTNIACFPSLEMALEPLTVLVGPNAAGKSTVLRALELLARWHSGGFEPDAVRTLGHWEGEHEWVGEEVWFYRKGSLPTLGIPRLNAKTWQVQAASTGHTFQVRQSGPQLEVKDGELSCLRSAEMAEQVSNFQEHDAEGLAWNDPFWARHLRYGPTLPGRSLSVQLLQLERRALAAPSLPVGEHAMLAADGSGLASHLSAFANTDREILEKIEADLREIVPQVRRIRTPEVRVRRPVMRPFAVGDQVIQVPGEEDQMGHRLELDVQGSGRVPAELLSEGTLIALGLLTAINHPRRPNLLLLDDLDRGLHLNAQVRVVRVIQRLQELNPQLQVVATTHSPFQLEGLQPEQIRVHAVRPDGTAAAARLADHPEIERWSKTFRTDELWANLGEDWVLEAGS